MGPFIITQVILHNTIWPGHLLCVSCLFSNNRLNFLSGYLLLTVCFTISVTFMTALCLCNNISRHIKITSMVLNFVTEI